MHAISIGIPREEFRSNWTFGCSKKTVLNQSVKLRVVFDEIMWNHYAVSTVHEIVAFFTFIMLCFICYSFIFINKKNSKKDLQKSWINTKIFVLFSKTRHKFVIQFV